MTENQEKFETLPAEYRAQALSTETSMFFNIAKFEHAQRLAGMFYQANMWPDHLKTVGDALIVLNLADRLRMDPVMLAQTIYIVHGKPGMEGKLIKALVDSSGKYKVPLRFKWVDDADKEIPKAKVVNDHTDDHRGCVAHTIGADGKELEGPKVDWHTVHSEGWYQKKGSKWPNMAELMFIYRSSSWFANTNCPEVKLGMQTTEELRDINTIDMVPNGAGSFAAETSTEDLAAKILNGNVDESISETDRDLGKTHDTPTITPEKFPEADVVETEQPETKPPETEPEDVPDEMVWYHTGLWMKKKTTGFTKFAIENASRFHEIPDSAVCVYAGKSKRVIDAMREKWYGHNPNQAFPGDPPVDPDAGKEENGIKTSVHYDPNGKDQEQPPVNDTEEKAETTNGGTANNPDYHRDMNQRMRKDFPEVWGFARLDLGFGMLPPSEEAAEIWNKKISAKLDEQDNGK